MSYKERAGEARVDKKEHGTFSAGVSRFHPDVYPRTFCLATSDSVHSRSGSRRVCYHQIKVPPLDVPLSVFSSCLKASNPHYGKERRKKKKKSAREGLLQSTTPLPPDVLLTEDTVLQLHQLMKVHVKTQNKITSL